MITFAQIQDVCRRYRAAKYFVDIPLVKLENARQKYRIPEAEPVIALIDSTVLGSAKQGLAVCQTGLFWRNLGRNPEYVTWEELSSLTVKVVSKGLGVRWWVFSDGREFNLAGAGELGQGRNDVVVRLLNDLTALAKGSTAAAPVGTGWKLAIRQQQFGPYDTEALIRMIAGGHIDQGVTLFWRPGMSNWASLAELPELTLPDAKAAPSQPRTRPDRIVAAELVPTAPTEPKAPPLAKTFMPAENLVDINNAPLDDLLNLPGLTLAAAQRLVVERHARLGFLDLGSIGEFLDLPPHKVQRLSERVTLKPFVGSGRPVTSARRRVVDF